MTVNGKDYVVPMVLEEPSVVAAVGNVARMTRPEGFVAESDEPVMVWALFPHVSHVSSLLPSQECSADNGTEYVCSDMDIFARIWSSETNGGSAHLCIELNGADRTNPCARGGRYPDGKDEARGQL